MKESRLSGAFTLAHFYSLEKTFIFLATMSVANTPGVVVYGMSAPPRLTSTSCTIFIGVYSRLSSGELTGGLAC
jgi:hypothetical protein